MTGKDIKNVLNFTAFLPEPDDPSAPWRKRFPNRRTLLFGIGKSTLSWRQVGRNGKVGESETVKADPKEALSEAAPQIKELADDHWCAISLNTRYVISLETNLSRRPGSEEILKINPRSVLGGRYERGKRYAVTHNPETNASILLTCDEEQIRKIESLFKETGFRVGRIFCATYLLLRHALALTNTTRGGDKPASFLYIICAQGCVCALVQEQDRWLELRSRTDIYDDGMDPVIELLTPFKSRLTPEIQIILLCDEPIPEFAGRVSELFSDHKLTDLSQPGLLWNLVVQN